MSQSEITIYQGAQTLASETDRGIAVLISRWIASKKSLRTQESYRATLADFRAFLVVYRNEADRPVDLLLSPWQEIEASALAFLPCRKRLDEEKLAYFEQDPERPVTVSTRNQRSAALRSFYEYAVNHEAITRNPLNLLKAEKGEKPRKAHALDVARVKTGLAAIDTQTLAGKRDKAMLALLLVTGNRVSEVTGLTWSRLWTADADLWGRFLCKGGKVQEKVIDRATAGLIEDYRQALLPYLILRKIPFQTNMPVFMNLSFHPGEKTQKRNPTRHLYQLSTETVSTISEKYLGESRVHATRHTRAVRAVKAGATYMQIKEDYGHSSLQVTTEYMEEQLREKRAYGEKLEQEYGL